MRPNVDFAKVLADNGAPSTDTELTAMLDSDITAANSIISNDSRYSPFWRLYRAVVITPALWIIKTLLATEVMPAMFLATATKTYLELKAWEVGIERKAAAATKGMIEFVKLDDSSDITVPAGTIITTDDSLGTVYSVTVDADTIIPAGQLTGAVATTASDTGTAYNLPAGYYYVLPAEVPGIASAANGEDWITSAGADEETDDDLALRVRDKKSATGNYHIDAVYRAALAEFAGISSSQLFFEHDAPRGPGTANCYVITDVGDVPSSLIEQLNAHIAEGYHGHGDDLQVFAMPTTEYALQATYRLTQSAPANAAVIIEAMIRAAFRESAEYSSITRTQPQSTFSFSLLSSELHNALPWLAAIRWHTDDIDIGLSLPRISSLQLENDA